MFCLLEEAFLLQEQVGVRKKPQDPAVQDASFDSLFIQFQVIAKPSVISAVFLVPSVFPEWDDPSCQMTFYI